MSKKVALVLSSGGARGVAHIGVIEGLIDHGFEISSIAGSSMGSVVGAFHACGKLPEFKEWISNLDRIEVFKLIDFTFSSQGFIRGEKVFKNLEKVIPDRPIEEMQIPFIAVSTDLNTQKEKVFDSGSMYHAIRASVAIPTVLTPLKSGESLYVDGGVTNPVPADKVKRTKGDILVVSNVNAFKPYISPLKKQEKKESNQYTKRLEEMMGKISKVIPGSSSAKKKLGFFDLLNDSLDLLQDRLTSELLKQYKPGLSVEVSRQACSTFEFYRAKEIIEAGRQAFEEALKASNLLSEQEQ
ncbi:patatin-like phospholipase family protein [uncultured Imperialibacter sp.]|uniref:patatin-like phospholipase family protein n=1 Tax=uncultured Imperialibacter sp. TaxID=1672639 RepID=UPI0030D87FFD|tara:strand:- start:53237 stop:54130 length:894 start_codon:yes stop_codon:yes gene_type:complete